MLLPALGAGGVTVDAGGASGGGAPGLRAGADHPSAAGPPKEPCNLSEPQFPGLRNGNNEEYILRG